MITATAPDQTAREAVRSVTAYLAVRPALELIDFVKRAFGAEEVMRTTGSAGGVHAEVRIGDTKVMIGGGAPGAARRRPPGFTSTCRTPIRFTGAPSRPAPSRSTRRWTSPMETARPA